MKKLFLLFILLFSFVFSYEKTLAQNNDNSEIVSQINLIPQCKWEISTDPDPICKFDTLHIYVTQIYPTGCPACSIDHSSSYPQYYKIYGNSGPIKNGYSNPYTWTDPYIQQPTCNGLGNNILPTLNPGTYTIYTSQDPNFNTIVDQKTITVYGEESVSFNSTYNISQYCDGLNVAVDLISPMPNTPISVYLHAPDPAYDDSWYQNNSFNHSFNLSMWGNYIIETTISNSCFDTVHFDTINVGPNPFFTTNGNYCPNQTINFFGNAQNCISEIQSWQWNFGDGNYGSGQNPTHTYLNAGTYNVILTVTGAYPGLQTSTITQQVTIHPLPANPQINGYFNTCHGNTNYSITNYSSSNSYYYTIGFNGTPTPFTQGTFNINWNNYPSGGVLYVYVTSNSTGCTSLDSLKVFECCSFGGLPQKNDETWTTSPSESAFVVNGILTINGNINLSNKQMNFGPNAKIVINPSFTLTLSNCTLKAVCRVMWDGIFINQSNSSLIVNNNTQIHNAKNAIVSNNCGIYQLSNNVILEANYKNIIVSTCPTTFNGSVSKTTFNGASQIMDQYPPILSTRTYSGIEINNVESIVVGNTTLADNRNVFYNMDFGIKNYCSNLEVYNNTFQNMSYGSLSYPPSSGVGIISTAGKFTPKNLTVGGISNGTFNTNKFESCFWGVYADYYQNVTIQRDTFNSTGSWTSIYLYSHPTKTIKVLSNVITDGMIGIHNGHCFNSTIDINSNRVTNTYYGIVAQNVNSGVVQKLNIYNNRVWNNTNGNGIWVTNIQGVQGSQTQIALISNNYVYMNNANLTQPSNGILVENCPYAFIQLNSVSKSSYNVTTEAQALNLNGIYVQLSPNSDICNNSLLRMGCGLRFYGAMPNSKVKRNAMAVNYFYGVRLDNANIGHQGDATYAWSNTWATNISNNRVQGTPSVVTNWNYVGNYGQANTYCPFPYSVTPPANLNLVNKLYNITSCSIPVQLPLSMQYSPILSNSNNYILTPDENKYWDEQHFYIDMQNSPAVLSSLSLSNSTYQSFYNTLSSGNIGRFVDVTNLMNNEDYSDAEVQNANISPTNAIEINRKNVNQVYLDTWANGRFEFTANERNVLEAIAYGEALLGGDAVYSARVMLGISMPVVSGTNKKMEQQSSLEKNVVSSIYPNPTMDMAYLEYTLSEGNEASIVLYNIVGTKVKTYFINSSSNMFEFTTNGLYPGLYFYKILLKSGQILDSNKLVILK